MEFLKKSPKGIKEYSHYIFDPEIMYNVFITNDICRKVCEKNGYEYWDQVAERSRELIEKYDYGYEYDYEGEGEDEYWDQD